MCTCEKSKMQHPNFQLMWMNKVIPRVWLGRPTLCATPLGLVGVGLWKLLRLLRFRGAREASLQGSFGSGMNCGIVHIS